jgi:hypothetical protein
VFCVVNLVLWMVCFEARNNVTVFGTLFLRGLEDDPFWVA